MSNYLSMEECWHLWGKLESIWVMQIHVSPCVYMRERLPITWINELLKCMYDFPHIFAFIAGAQKYLFIYLFVLGQFFFF